MAKNKELQGLGGWLVVVGFNVVTTPLFLVAEVYPLFVAIFSEGGLTTVPPPGSKSSHPFWKPLLFTEVGVISAFVLASFYLAILFFSKNKQFPQLYVGFLVLVAVFSLANSLVVHAIDPTSSIFNQSVTGPFLQTLIWGSYMAASERVKVTFVQ